MGFRSALRRESLGTAVRAGLRSEGVLFLTYSVGRAGGESAADYYRKGLVAWCLGHREDGLSSVWTTRTWPHPGDSIYSQETQNSRHRAEEGSPDHALPPQGCFASAGGYGPVGGGGG